MHAELKQKGSRTLMHSCCPSASLLRGLLLIVACAAAQRIALAQEAAGQAQRGSGALPLLSRSDVRAELDLTDEQIAAVKKLNQGLPTRLREMGLGSKDLSPNEKRLQIAKFDEQLGTDLNDLLLPHQLKRLRQIEMQLRFQGVNISEELVNREVIKALHVNDDQLRQWHSIREEVDREYDRERIAIRQQALARFLAELRPDQAERWHNLFGVPFLSKEKPASPRNGSTAKTGP